MLVVAGLLCSVVAYAVGAPRVRDAFSDGVPVTVRSAPAHEQVRLKAGTTYSVYELVGSHSQAGPLHVQNQHMPVLTADDVTVQAAAGSPVAVRPLGALTETLDRGSELYDGIAHIPVTATGSYLVTVTPPQFTSNAVTVLVAPSVGSTAAQVARPVVAGVAGFLVFVLGVVLLIVGLDRRRVALRGLSSPVPPPASHLPPPGWYPAPDAPGRQRYWDGRTWTDALR